MPARIVHTNQRGPVRSNFFKVVLNLKVLILLSWGAPLSLYPGIPSAIISGAVEERSPRSDRWSHFSATQLSAARWARSVPIVERCAWEPVREAQPVR